MNAWRCGGLVLLVLAGGCASSGAGDQAMCNPFNALGRDCKAFGRAAIDTTDLQHDVPCIAQDLAESGPRLRVDLLRMKDVLFEEDCRSDDDR